MPSNIPRHQTFISAYGRQGPGVYLISTTPLSNWREVWLGDDRVCLITRTTIDLLTGGVEIEVVKNTFDQEGQEGFSSYADQIEP